MLSRKIKDIAGQRFGRLIALSYAGSDKSGNAKWNCRCDCGVEKSVLGQALRSGAVVSCKCYANELAAQNKLTHGLSATTYYKAWFGMIQRCENKNHTKWKRYGARGIKVRERWHAFENFLADMGQRPEGTSIERVDNDGNYEPGNCEWADRATQMSNKSDNRWLEFSGLRMTVSQWAIHQKIPRATIFRRLRTGLPVEKVLEPITRK